MKTTRMYILGMAALLLVTGVGCPFTVNNSGDKPVADYTYSVSPTALTLQFEDKSSAPEADPITAYAWDFGDGAASSVRNPSHTFAAEGDYQVTLQVTNGAGVASATKTVTVSASGTPDDEGQPVEGDAEGQSAEGDVEGQPAEGQIEGETPAEGQLPDPNANDPVIISEFLASNTVTEVDEDGEASDWIELYNKTDADINLSGWALTDDPDLPAKWVLPVVTIRAQQHLMIYASGKDRRIADGSNLHTNFKLSANGEFLSLFNAEGVRQNGSTFDNYPEQFADVSYGVYSTVVGYVYLTPPTPGYPNDTSTIYTQTQAAAPLASVARGVYASPFDVTLTSATPDATVYYTTDGTIPNVSNWQEATAPIRVDKPTNIRAVALKDGYSPSPLSTFTWITGVPGAQTSLPVISVVGNPWQDLYEPNGIMAIVGGEYYQPDPVNRSWYWIWRPINPGDYNNVLLHGSQVEREVSVEWLDNAGANSFQVGCKIAVNGSDTHRTMYQRGEDWFNCENTGRSASYKKFSFQLEFSANPPVDGVMAFPFYSNTPKHGYPRIVLRGGNNDGCNPFIRDEMGRRIARDMGMVTARGSMANLFINGVYRGYYNPSERVDETFLQEQYDADGTWDVITTDGLRDGDDGDWTALIEYVQAVSLRGDAEYDYVASRLDLTQLADYLIVQLYLANVDWPYNNWTVARQQPDVAPGPAGYPALNKFRFYLWDLEYTMDDRYYDKVGIDSYPPWESEESQGLIRVKAPLGYLWRALMTNPRFPALFNERVHLHFGVGGALTQVNMTYRFRELEAEMKEVIPDMDQFIPDHFIPEREAIVLQAFQTAGVYTP